MALDSEFPYWEILSNRKSVTIKVDRADAFRLLEEQVQKNYGEPEDKDGNGRIYRGCDPDDKSVIVTFYGTTCTVHVQGVSYNYWVEEVLPEFAKIVMKKLESPDDN